MKSNRWTMTGLAVALLLAMALGALLNAPAALAQARSRFEWIITRQLTVLQDTELLGSLDVAENVDIVNDLGVDGDADVTGNLGSGPLAVTGNASVSGSLSVVGAAGFADDVNLVAQSAITVTNAATFTVGGGVQRIQASGSVTPVLNPGTQGQMVTLLNITNQNITIADTSGQMLSANWVGGQWDTLTLYYYGTSWIELARSNN